MSRTILIDGYNLLHRGLPGLLGKGSLEAARGALRALVAAHRGRCGSDCRVVIVWDGKADAGPAQAGVVEGVREVFSRYPRSADDLILSMCRQRPPTEDVVVVTSDRFDIAHRLPGLRCRHETSESFARRLDQDPRSTNGPAAGRRGSGSEGDEHEKPGAPDASAVQDWLRTFDLAHDEDLE